MQSKFTRNETALPAMEGGKGVNSIRAFMRQKQITDQRKKFLFTNRVTITVHLTGGVWEICKWTQHLVTNLQGTQTLEIP
jgi:hypothetical protein